MRFSQLTCKKFDFLNSNIEKKIGIYINLLLSWNKKINLVGMKDAYNIYNNLIIDSFYLYYFFINKFKEDNYIFLDLGAGAGIPGIPFRILYTKGTYYLIEIRKKRVVFLKNCILDLKLKNTFVLDEYVEKINLDKKSDFIIARAFKPYKEVLSISRRIIKQGGRVIILANQKYPAEIPSSWNLEESLEYNLKEKKRYFWVFEFLNI